MSPGPDYVLVADFDEDGHPDIATSSVPDVPAVGEFVSGYEGSNWVGVAAPRNTAAEIVAKLNSEINGAMADPKIKARLADLGATALLGSVDDFRKFIADDTEKWGKIIRAANIKVE